MVKSLLLVEKGIYKIAPGHSRRFNSLGKISEQNVNIAFEFSYNMTFGGLGKFRSKSNGGSENRYMGEIFANSFQGKLAELSFYEFIISQGIDIPFPDFTVADQGIWDDVDFLINDKKIGIKSTKSFGNLLLLETDMWSKDGVFIGDLEKTDKRPYDFFVLVRIQADIEKIMRKYLKSDEVSKKDLWACFSPLPQNNWNNELYTWEYDIPGYAPLNLVKQAIAQNNILNKGELFNKTKMKVDNYYLLTSDLNSIDFFATSQLKK